MNERAADEGEANGGDSAEDPDAAAEEQSAGAAGIAAARAEVESLKREIAAATDKFLRLAAELDNVRKRSAREVDAARRFGIERFARELLPVVDSLEAALTAAENADIDALREGQRATLKLIEQAFADAGITTIDPRGAPFDPNLHEAISLLPVPGAAPESVVEVVQRGYALQERLLRPARVIVAKASASD